jgi:putative peptidoglycan lipid II flippase
MASWLDEGNVSIIHYADRLYTIPVLFLVSGLMVILLSHWSEKYVEFGIQRIKRDVKKSISVVGLMAFAIMAFLIPFHGQIVKLAFGRGAFNQARLHDVGWVFVCYLFGFVPFIIGQIFVRAHLALKNTKVLMECAFCLVLLNILFNYILMKAIGVAGIALATSVTSVFSVSYLSYIFYRRLRREN